MEANVMTVSHATVSNSSLSGKKFKIAFSNTYQFTLTASDDYSTQCVVFTPTSYPLPPPVITKKYFFQVQERQYCNIVYACLC